MPTMDFQTYKTEVKALAAIKEMRGWPKARTTQLYLPDDDNTDTEGNAWIIIMGHDGYGYCLRRDGYVR